MVNEAELNRAIGFVQEFRTNAARSLNIRLKISEQRVYAVRLLERNRQDIKGINLLRRCLYRERQLLKIINRNLENSYEKLAGYSAWIRIIVKDEELKNNVERLLEIIRIFDSKLDGIDKRLELEGFFIEKRDYDSYKKFLRQWEKELKLDKKLLKKIVDANDLESYFKKIKVAFEEGRGAMLMGVGGAALGIKIFDEFINNPTKENIPLLLGVLSFILGLAGIIGSLKKVEERIMLQNLLQLENAIKVEKESR